jgi:hypothetical protein
MTSAALPEWFFEATHRQMYRHENIRQLYLCLSLSLASRLEAGPVSSPPHICLSAQQRLLPPRRPLSSQKQQLHPSSYRVFQTKWFSWFGYSLTKTQSFEYFFLLFVVLHLKSSYMQMNFRRKIAK